MLYVDRLPLSGLFCPVRMLGVLSLGVVARIDVPSGITISAASPLPVAIVWMSRYPSFHSGRYSGACAKALSAFASSANANNILFIVIIFLSMKSSLVVLNRHFGDARLFLWNYRRMSITNLPAKYGSESQVVTGQVETEPLRRRSRDIRAQISSLMSPPLR